MKIPGYAYILVGVLVAGVSGYVYKFLPRNGEPNNGMAVFFFVGLIFILIGVAKLFFRKVDTENAMILEKDITKNEQMHLHDQHKNISSNYRAETPSQTHINRVEQQINKIYQTEHPQNNMNAHGAQNTGHTSSYAQSHPYHTGQAPQPAPNNPGAHHPARAATQAAHTPYTIVQCPKCQTKNYSHSNYCHGCGHRLR